jgi:hypothetical protein
MLLVLALSIYYEEAPSNSTLSDYTQARHARRERVSSAMACPERSRRDGKPKFIHGAWIPAQICLEQICINPKGSGQESPE